jgi:cytochrome c-type biogenesis protein
MGPIESFGLAAFALALAAGAVSFLSPCVLPLLPGYLSFVSGVSVDDLQSDSRRVVTATLAFVLGFSLTFTLAGAGAALVGGVFLDNKLVIQFVSGGLLVLMGVAVSGLVPLSFSRERRLLPFRRPQRLLGAGLAGVAFAVGWTPCVGPILASILTLAAGGSDPGRGALLLFVYSLGLGVPFLLSGLFFTRAMTAFSWIKRHFRAVRLVSGGLLVAYGILILTGELAWLTRILGRYQLFEF